jgi:hypothetical protein
MESLALQQGKEREEMTRGDVPSDDSGKRTGESVPPVNSPSRSSDDSGRNGQGSSFGSLWKELLAGALAGISLLGAFLSSWNTGKTSQSADKALEAKYLTIEAAEKAKERLDDFEAHQKTHDAQIELLVKRLEDLEHKLRQEMRR